MRVIKNILIVIFLILPSINAQSGFFNKGYEEYQNGSLLKAIEWFSVSISKHERLASSYLYRGAAKIFMGNLKEAEQDIDVAYKIDSTTSKIYYYYGKLFLFQQNLK